jgi:transposase-like protein
MIAPTYGTRSTARSARPASALQLTGEGGLLRQLTKRLLESALGGEISDHLGYGKHGPAGKDGGNSSKRQQGQDGADRRRPDCGEG